MFLKKLTFSEIEYDQHTKLSHFCQNCHPNYCENQSERMKKNEILSQKVFQPIVLKAIKLQTHINLEAVN